MISVKSDGEIERMRIGGKILSETLIEVLANLEPGVSELKLDSLAEKLIRKNSAEPGFKKVKGYHHSICTSTNNIVVHGIPTSRMLQEGDIVGIDCGVYYKGFFTDMAETVRVEGPARGPISTLVTLAGPVAPPHPMSSSPVGESGRSMGVPRSAPPALGSPHIHKFLEIGKKALFEGIKRAKPGNRVGHISQVIQKVVESAGYSVVRSLVGHGVGKKLHEDPEVPGYLVGKVENTPLLKPGMTIAIEVIYNMGKQEVEYSGNDGWTIVTADGSLSGLFERTILVTKNGPEILTRLSKIKNGSGII